MAEDNILRVKVLGGFSMTWNGKALSGGSKASESQAMCLIQILLHRGKQGISRDELEEMLFEERDLANPHHALRSVTYNAKKKLQTIGMPDVNYIYTKKGVYYWCDEIPVQEDAIEMERLYEEGKTTKDLDEQLGIFLDACHLYSGEFMGGKNTSVWAIQEDRHYRMIFSDCVERAVSLLRVNQDYMQMEELGVYASSVCPLCDWEVVTMEALVSMGRLEDARKLYDATVELYMREQGLHPSAKLLELMSHLGAQMEHTYAMLDEIQMGLAMEESQSNGGYLCSYPIFRGIYQMVRRMMERGGQSVYLMLCTVVDSKGNPMKDGPILDELSQRLGDCIRHSVRMSDAINRYNKGQYLVLLVNTTRENCEIVQKRINYRFIVGRQRTGIQYYVNSVIRTPDMDLW